MPDSIAGLPGRAVGGKDLIDHTFHVRHIRQHLPGNDWHRLFVENHVSRGQDSAIAVVGYCGTGKITRTTPTPTQVAGGILTIDGF